MLCQVHARRLLTVPTGGASDACVPVLPDACFHPTPPFPLAPPPSPPPAPPSQPQLPDLATQRANYERAWQALESQPPLAPAAKAPPPLQHKDVPWPVPEGAGEQQLRDLMLHGVEGPGDIKRRLRAELLRWHPDKFEARFAARLPPAGSGERARIAAHVHEVSQLLTKMISGGAAG